MPSVWLPRGVEVLVSPEDVHLIAQHTWWEHRSTHTGNSYAYTLTRSVDALGQKHRHKVYMHRLITGCPEGWSVDHKNRQTLDNRRGNLRITTGTFQNANREFVVNRTGYRGVQKIGNSRYRARIEYQGVQIRMGPFSDAQEAARAYDQKALELFGEFAWLNFDSRRGELEEERQAIPDPAWSGKQAEALDMDAVPF